MAPEEWAEPRRGEVRGQTRPPGFKAKRGEGVRSPGWAGLWHKWERVAAWPREQGRRGHGTPVLDLPFQGQPLSVGTLPCMTSVSAVSLGSQSAERVCVEGELGLVTGDG